MLLLRLLLRLPWDLYPEGRGRYAARARLHLRLLTNLRLQQRWRCG